MAGPEDQEFEDDPVVRAGEYALGLLEGEELALAQREVLRSSEFSDLVDWWLAKFAALSEEAGTAEPSAQVWQSISARLDESGPAAITPIRTGLAGWRLAGVVAATAAAAAAIALFFAPVVQEPTAAPAVPGAADKQLFASATGADGEFFATRFDPADGALRLDVAGLTPEDADRRSAELWVVPEGGAPVSLGLIPGEGQAVRKLDARQTALLVNGATLAVTIEERASAPHRAPTTPILAAGRITEL